MSIGERLRNLLLGRPHVRGADGDDVALTEEYGASERKDLDEARIDAGGSGAVGPPESHESPAENVAEAETESEPE